MKRFTKLLLGLCPSVALLLALAPAAYSSTNSEDVSKCFVVHEMSKNDDLRYLVDAVSRSSREYEAVYVMVSFLDGAGRYLGDGVWPIYWCRPGRREYHEFSVPRAALGYERVILRRITTDFREAMR